MQRISPALAASGVSAGARPSKKTRREVAASFRRLLAEGATLHPAGMARHDPSSLLAPRFAPRYEVELFDTRILLTDPHQTPELRFFVAYVVQRAPRSEQPRVFPRIFYKDISLIWRAASHRIVSAHDAWIGKGDVRTFERDGRPFLESVESTTDLPLELQTALEEVLRRAHHVRSGARALDLVLRTTSRARILPYPEFLRPRREAAADPRRLINGGRKVARFRRAGDPTSLRFVRGFEPDFEGGLVETSRSRSTLYGGSVRRYRVVSSNRKIQYLFMVAPRHAWVIPPQSLGRELTSFALRPIDVHIDDDLAIPGFEFHFMDESVDPPRMHSQIPAGYAGAPSPLDEARCDASRWIEAMPVMRSFREQVLGARGRG